VLFVGVCCKLQHETAAAATLDAALAAATVAVATNLLLLEYRLLKH